jgi:hypothetical protein
MTGSRDDEPPIRGEPTALLDHLEHDRCRPSAGATVKDRPEQVSRISRSRVNDQVTPVQHHPGHDSPVGAEGFEPPTFSL